MNKISYLIASLAVALLMLGGCANCQKMCGNKSECSKCMKDAKCGDCAKAAACEKCAKGEKCEKCAKGQCPKCEKCAAAGKCAGIQELVAAVNPTAGNKAHGVVRFTKTEAGVKIVADLEGLTPGAKHAFHIHESGDATAANGSSAGGHYNPANNPHGQPGDEKRHAGDLGNVVADANGKAHYERVDTQISLTGPCCPIVGLAVIIHAGEDKFTQPVGDAGARIGIGVIGIVKPAAPASAVPAAAK